MVFRSQLRSHPILRFGKRGKIGKIPVRRNQFSGHIPVRRNQFSGKTPVTQNQFSGKTPVTQNQFSGHTPVTQKPFSGHTPVTRNRFSGHTPVTQDPWEDGRLKPTKKTKRSPWAAAVPRKIAKSGALVPIPTVAWASKRR